MSTSADRRPPLWIGHVSMQAADIKVSNDYWVKAGMRPLVDGEGFAVLELRGGTHLVLVRSEEPLAAGTPCPFDLMVEDLDATHAHFARLELEPSEVSRGEIHDSFTLTDPTGYVVTINSTHVSDQPV